MSVFANKSALVTGASAGLGEEFARQLADLGVTHLLLTARRGDRLEALKARLIAAHPSLTVDVIAADISESSVVTWFLNELENRGFRPDILINNAGFGDLGNFSSSNPALIESMIELNVVALTRLSRWALGNMVEKKSGWICNVGSTAGMIPLPTFAVYAATKAYVNSFSEALRIEVRPFGVHVMALCPGPVETEFVQVASRPNTKRSFTQPAHFWVPKDKVVSQTLRAMERRQGRLIPGLSVRFFMLFAESMPRWILRLVFDWLPISIHKTVKK